MGFEPTVTKATHALQACLIVHSSTSPCCNNLTITDSNVEGGFQIILCNGLPAEALAQAGGEGGIRTHAPESPETAFREQHHKPLGHLSQSRNFNMKE